MLSLLHLSVTNDIIQSKASIGCISIFLYFKNILLRIFPNSSIMSYLLIWKAAVCLCIDLAVLAQDLVNEQLRWQEEQKVT